MAASSSSSQFQSSTEDLRFNLHKDIRLHEIAIGELNELSASRVVYQKTCNLFFRKDVETVKASEQKLLDASKAQLNKLNLT